MVRGKAVDLTGQRFGDWLVLYKIGPRRGVTRWLTVCACGVTGAPSTSALRGGKSSGCRSCGAKRGGAKLRGTG